MEWDAMNSDERVEQLRVELDDVIQENRRLKKSKNKTQ
jgi:hypothetical protein